MQQFEKVVLRIAITGTPEGIRECVRKFALDLPNDISRVEFAPLEMARLEGVEQPGEQGRAEFTPPRLRRKGPAPCCRGSNPNQSSPPAPRPRPPPLRLNASGLAHSDPLERPSRRPRSPCVL